MNAAPPIPPGERLSEDERRILRQTEDKVNCIAVNVMINRERLATICAALRRLATPTDLSRRALNAERDGILRDLGGAQKPRVFCEPNDGKPAATPSAGDAAWKYDRRYWQEGVHGNANVVTFDGEDVRPVLRIEDAVLRAKVIAAHNDTIRALTRPQGAATLAVDDARRLATVGWNACRRQVFSLCEHIGDEPDDSCPDRFVEGRRNAAKSIAKAMNGFEAADCDLLRAALNPSQAGGGK